MLSVKNFKLGQKVYTVNNKTNDIDTWTYCGGIPAKDAFLCQVKDDSGRMMFIPEKCVFSSKSKAKKIKNFK